MHTFTILLAMFFTLVNVTSAHSNDIELSSEPVAEYKSSVALMDAIPGEKRVQLSDASQSQSMNKTTQFAVTESVPEPSTYVLVLLGLILLLQHRQRRSIAKEIA